MTTNRPRRIWAAGHGVPVPPEDAVHHLDENHANNALTNLLRVPASQHQTLFHSTPPGIRCCVPEAALQLHLPFARQTYVAPDEAVRTFVATEWDLYQTLVVLGRQRCVPQRSFPLVELRFFLDADVVPDVINVRTTAIRKQFQLYDFEMQFFRADYLSAGVLASQTANGWALLHFGVQDCKYTIGIRYKFFEGYRHCFRYQTRYGRFVILSRALGLPLRAIAAQLGITLESARALEARALASLEEARKAWVMFYGPRWYADQHAAADAQAAKGSTCLERYGPRVSY